MTKKELVAAVSEKTGLTKKDSEAALSAVLDAISESLSKVNDVQLTGFGTFSVKARAEHTGKNPKTGAAITIPACKVPAFKAGKGLKDAVAE